MNKEFYLKPISGETITVSSDNHRIVYDLKTTYNLKKGRTVEDVHHTFIIYKGERLHNLFDLNQLPHGSVLHVLCKLDYCRNKGIMYLDHLDKKEVE